MGIAVVLKQLIVEITVVTFMSLGAYAYADTCGVEGNGMQVYVLGRMEYWLFTWSGEKTIKQKTARPHPYFEEGLNTYDSLGNKKSLGLPQYLLGPDVRLDVPFDVSKDGQMLIASIHPNNAVLIPSRKIALIALISKRLVSVIETEYGVYSLAWSPTGEYFAVLLSEDATRAEVERAAGLDFKIPWASHSLQHTVH